MRPAPAPRRRRAGGGAIIEREDRCMTTKERRPQIIAIANQKGGVGKPTTAVALWALLNDRGYPTLLVDADPQASATLASGFDMRQDYFSLYPLMQGQMRGHLSPDL